MDVQAVISKAKAYVKDIFEPEGAFNIGLEEVQFEDNRAAWDVTIGFSRPWDRVPGNVIVPASDRRTYKVVQIEDETGRVLAVKNRPTPEV